MCVSIPLGQQWLPRVGDEDEQQRTAIEMAQQAYLPKKVNYYVKGNEHGLEELARSFGVNQKDLCRWNQMHLNDVLYARRLYGLLQAELRSGARAPGEISAA